jgi:predicted nuclease of restriction endonuclease-like (RecB) superfamily
LTDLKVIEFLRQLVAEIPWGQNLLILNKLTDPATRLYYLRATARFGWTRDVLLNQVKAGAYERAVTEKKTHNFELALPEHLAEQADEMLKSRYNLEFLGIGPAVKERELEDRLIGRLQQFILELGYGFCFVGRQYRLALGRKE